MEDNIYQQIKEVFRQVLGDDTIAVEAQTTAKDIPEWDSIMHVLLIVAVEKRFGVKFTAAEVQSLQNVGELANLISLKSS